MEQPLHTLRTNGRIYYTAFLLLLCCTSFAQIKPAPLAGFTNQLSQAKSERLTQLIKELQPSVYVTQNEINVHGDAPVCVYTDQSAQHRLSGNNFDKTSVELVSIVVSTAPAVIDLSPLADFPSLDYLLLRVPSAQSVQGLQFTGEKPGLSIVYEINVTY